MPEVQVGNDVVEFPDSMSDQEIRDALAKEYPPVTTETPQTQKPSALKQAILNAARAFTGSVIEPQAQAQAALPGLLGKPIEEVSRAGGDLLTDFLNRTGIDPSAMQGRPIGGETPSLPIMTIPGTSIAPLDIISPSVRKGIESGAGKLFEGVRTPEMVSTLPFAGLKPVQALYAAGAAGAVPESVKGVLQAKTPQEAAEAGTMALANAAISYGLGRNLAKPKVPTAEAPLVESEVTKEAPLVAKQPKITVEDLSAEGAAGAYTMATGKVRLDKSAISKMTSEERADLVRHELAHKIEYESELWPESDTFLWNLWETDKRHPIWDLMGQEPIGRSKFNNDVSPEIIAELYAKHYPKGTFTVTERPVPYESEGEELQLPKEYPIPEPLMSVLDRIEDRLGIWKKKAERATRKEAPPSAVSGEAKPSEALVSKATEGAAATAPLPQATTEGNVTPTVTQAAETGAKAPETVGMGGATPSEFPGSKDSLEQLTDNIKAQGRISPDEGFASRLKQALGAVAEKWKNRPKDVGQALEQARAGSAVLLDKYMNLPKYTDFIRSIREWTGADNETALQVRKFVKELNRSVPNKLRQEAITNWIQADGDEALLRERAAASDPKVRRGYELALELNDAEKSLARNLQSYLESRLNEGINAGILKQGVENYITQIWKKETPPTKALWADLFGTGTLNPNFRYARRRIFDSYFEGEQAGYTPRNKSVGSLIASYDLAFNRALSARALIKQLHEGKAADGMPIVMVSGKSMPIGPEDAPPEAVLIKPNMAPKGAVTADGRPYRNIDHWALRDWKWATKGPEGQPVFVQGDLLVHPDHYRHLNNVLKASRLAQPEGITRVTRAALRAGALAKQTKLSLSLFHLDQEGVHAMAHRVNPANLEQLDLSHPMQRELVMHGLQVADPRAQELFSEGLSGGGLVSKIPGIGHLQSWFNDFLFRDYIPRIKMTMALDALDRNLKAYKPELDAGKITEDQIMALTADESNAAFGELNYRALGRSPTVQDFFRLTLLAPDFLEARGRFVGQALKPYGREQRIALGLMGATLYVGGRILNQWLDNDPHWDKPFSAFYKGREYRLRTILGDVQHLITDPRSFWYNRMSPFTRTAVEYVTGRDDRGIKRNSMEQMADLAQWFRPIPTQVRSDQTIPQAALQSLGISSKKYDAQNRLFELVDEWKKTNPDPRIQAQYERHRQETLPDSMYRPMRDALIKNDLKQAKAEYQKLLKTEPRQKIIEAMQPRKPFTGSWAHDRRFLNTLNMEQRKLYDAAAKEKQQLFQRFVEIQP